METLKNQSAKKTDQNVLPYRTYIWKGAAEVPETPATPEYKEEGWCFVYGEKEWMGKFLMMLRKQLTRQIHWGDQEYLQVH